MFWALIEEFKNYFYPKQGYFFYQLTLIPNSLLMVCDQDHSYNNGQLTSLGHLSVILAIHATANREKSHILIAVFQILRIKEVFIEIV